LAVFVFLSVLVALLDCTSTAAFFCLGFNGWSYLLALAPTWFGMNGYPYDYFDEYVFYDGFISWASGARKSFQEN